MFLVPLKIIRKKKHLYNAYTAVGLILISIKVFTLVHSWPVLFIVLFSNSSGMKNSGIWAIWAPKKLSSSDRYKMTCRALYRLVESVKEKVMLVFMT